MLLRWFYYSVSLILALPFLAWQAIVSILMWDVNYWDNACEGVFTALTENKEDFLNSKNKS
jgi:hypothetical protein